MSTGTGAWSAPGRLRIERVEVERFGGLVDRVVTVPDDPFVVLSGANETGKSTLVELVSWLLVGPSGTAGEVQRFGNRGASIGGRLRGRLDGSSGGGTVERFDTVGGFLVAAKGAPNTSGLRVHLGRPALRHDAAVTAPVTGPVAELDLGSWLTRLGGVDAVVFDAVYRLRGEQLHDGGAVEAHLSQVALAGVAGRVDPRELVEQLGEQVKRLTTTRAAGAETVARLSTRLTELHRSLGEASTTAAEHARVRVDRADADAERGQRRLERDRLRARRSAAQVLLDADEVAREVEGLQQQVDRMPPIPDGWAPLVADPAALATAVTAAEEADGRWSSAARTLEVTAEELGQPAVRLAQLALDDAELAELARRTEVLRAADAALVDAQERSTEAVVALERTVGLLDRVVDVATRGGRLPDRATVAAVRLDADGRSTAGLAIERWSQQLDACAAEDRRLDAARRVAEEAAARRRLDTEAWDRLGTERPAAAWLAQAVAGRSGGAGHGTATDRADRADRWAWLLPGSLALVAVVAGLAGERWSGAVAAVTALLTAVAVLVLVRRRPRVDAGPPEVEGTASRWFDTAQRAVEAEGIERQRRADVAVVEAARRETQAAAERARTAAERTLAGLGVPIADTPEATRALVESWASAAELFRGEEQAREDLAVAQRRVDLATGAVSTAEEELRSLIRRVGLGDDLPVRSVAALAPRLRSGAALAREVDRLRREAAGGRQVVEALVAPVAAETVGWRWARIVERVDALHEIERARTELEARCRERRAELEFRLGADPEVRALAAEAPSRATLTGMVEDLRREEAAAERAVQESSELVGALDARLLELERADRVVEVSAALGTVHERRDELVAEAASRALAASLLATVTEEHERAHQPAIAGRAEELARSVAPTWEQVRVRAAGPGRRLEVEVHQRGGTVVPAMRLSTGARALLYLSFRLALADHDAARRGVSLPLLCDDPLVHVDDERAEQVARLLAAAADRGHQVLLFTCQDRTVDAARRAGAVHVALDGADRTDRTDRVDPADPPPTARLLHQSP